MVLKLYIYKGSPPCRAVIITSKLLKIPVEICLVTHQDSCPNTAAVKKLNVKATVPILVDDGLILCDSHAINCYLVDKYGKDQQNLYPSDICKRAAVNEMLHFDTGSLFSYLHQIWNLVLTKEATHVPNSTANSIKKSYSQLEEYLTNSNWVCGEHLTIADFSAFTSVTTLTDFVKLDDLQHSHIINWIKRVNDLPCCAEDCEALEDCRRWFQSILY